MSKPAVYLYGMTLVTTSHRLAGDFPSPSGYGEVVESHRLPGGETGTCAVVLGNLGLNVLLDGNHLGRNTSRDILSYFALGPVSTELLTVDPDFDGLEDTVYIDNETRTGFGRFIQFYADRSTRHWNSANEAAIRAASVVGLDPFFLEESVEAAQMCRRHHVRFATVDCASDSEIHALSEVNIVSDEFLQRTYPDRDLESVFAEYTRNGPGLVIFTFGAKELWFGRIGQDIQRFSPFRVEVESTLGAGDSFKAGVIYGMCKGMEDASLIRFASATAAAACMNYPIALAPPTLEAILSITG